MKISELNERLTYIFGEEIKLAELLNQQAKKSWEHQYRQYPENDFKDNFIYGVKIDGMIYFNFSAKSIDSLMKRFYTAFINKYLARRSVLDEEGNFSKLGVKAAKELLQQSIKTERLAKFISYSTNYGVGVWVFFIPEKDIKETKSRIEEVLNNNGISYKNEYSDAGWVLRYKFEGNYLDHNKIIEQL